MTRMTGRDHPASRIDEQEPSLMHWTFAMAYGPRVVPDGVTELPWLERLVPEDRHEFQYALWRGSDGESWHYKTSPRTTRAQWAELWRHSGSAWAIKKGGIITNFPQIAATVGLRKRLTREDVPLVAWTFNLGRPYGGAKAILARAAFSRVDRFVVHSRRERRTYSDWLGVPEERFRFVALQRPMIAVTHREEEGRPFLLAMGSANRDYRTFFRAVETLNLRTVVVAARHAVEGLRVPSCVELLSGLTQEQCHALAQQARVNVVPIDNDSTASGQVTVIEAMCQRRPVIATRSIGTEDYIEDGATGLLVEPGSAEGMAEAIRKLWDDPALRRRLAENAGQYAEDHLSDEAAGLAFTQILDEVEAEYLGRHPEICRTGAGQGP
jgi:glycosyltransferase involved in cell wall biosynthesis